MITHFYMVEKGFKPKDFFISIDEIEPRIVFSTKKEINFNDIIEHNNKQYIIGSAIIKDSATYCKIEEVFLVDVPLYSNLESQITCPYCGWKDVNSWEVDESSEDYECGFCSSIFGFEREVTVEYTSYPIKKNDNVVKVD